MKRDRATIILCVLGALFAGAFAAEGAAGATKGTTAFTCKETGPGGGFTKAHCTPSDAGSGNFSHVAIAQDTKTLGTTSNEKTGEATTASTPVRLKATIGGVPLELRATGAHGEGTMENKLDPSGEHYVEVHGSTKYTGVTVITPAGKGCKVFTDAGGVKGEEGVIDTEPLTVTTTGQDDHLKFTPETGEVFARFFLDGCIGLFESLNRTYTVSGSVSAQSDGATVKFVHSENTLENTLKLNGSIKVGLELTTRSLAGHEGGSTAPISLTTVET
jgi:hypothetical protein